MLTRAIKREKSAGRVRLPGPVTPVSETNPLQGLRILLVDDHPVNQKVASYMLQKIGVEAKRIANHGIEAVEAVRSEPFDVVLMDLQMPNMGGLEATQVIRNDPAISQQPYIIALTANAMDSDREMCRAASMEGFLAKPLRQSELQAALLEAVALRAQTG